MAVILANLTPVDTGAVLVLEVRELARRYVGDDDAHAIVTEVSGRTLYLWMPQLKEMRQLPEFKALLREIGIVAHWQEYGWPDICRPLDNDTFICD